MGAIETGMRDLFLYSKKVALNNNGSHLRIFLDMLSSLFLYGATPNNYYFFDFFNLKHRERKTYFTRRDSQRFMRKLNDNKYRHVFEVKTAFAEVFSKYFKREWLSTENLTVSELEMFLKNREEIIYKPLSEIQGRGIEVVRVDQFDTIENMHDYLKTRPAGIIEELIDQHEILSKVYPGSVATIRIMTILNGKEPEIMTAAITYGNGHVVANHRLGGIASPVDIKTGLVYAESVDNRGNAFSKHPITNERTYGFKIPYWDEVIEIVKEASQVEKRVKYLGWDIAIAKDGPLVIEANSNPGFIKLQTLKHLEKGAGIRKPYYKAYNKAIKYSANSRKEHN